MENMTDYLGNEVKSGMNVVIIRTKPLFRDSFLLNIKTGKMNLFRKAKKECWEILHEYEMFDCDGILMCKSKVGEYTLIESTFALTFGLQPNDIITIKGISDKRKLWKSRNRLTLFRRFMFGIASDFSNFYILVTFYSFTKPGLTHCYFALFIKNLHCPFVSFFIRFLL